MSDEPLKPAQAADLEAAGRARQAEAATREWWGRLPLMLTRPVGVFEALRVRDEIDDVGRSEPVLLVIILAGMAGVSMSPVWGRLLDDPEIDGVLVAVLTFIAGGMYGAAGYFLLGLAVYLGARGVGSTESFRLARQVLAFSAVPLALAFFVVVPLELLAFGSDAYRSGGSDDGAAGTAVRVVELAFVAWTIGLLAVGLRTVYRLAWSRVAGAFALTLLFLAAFVALPSAL